MKFKVNTRLLPIKAHFFLVFAAAAPIVPFLPIYAKQMGIDTIGVGVIFAVLPFMGMLAKPVAGWVADRFSLQKFVFLFGLFLTGAGYSSLMLVPSLVPDNPSLLDCSSPLSILKVCRTKAAWQSLELPEMINCSLSCSLNYQGQFCSAWSLPDCREDGLVSLSLSSNLTLHDTQPVPGCLFLPVDAVTSANSTQLRPVCPRRMSVKCQALCDDSKVRSFIRQDSAFSSPSFWIFFFLNIIAYSSFGVVTSMSDAICFDQLEGKPEDYGNQRVWGSIGWGLFTVIAGFLVDQGSEQGSKDYTPAFILLAGLLLLDLIMTWLSVKMASPDTQGRMVLVAAVRLLGTVRVMIFVVWCVVCGILQSLYWIWLPPYLQDLAEAYPDTQKWLTLLIGLNMGVQCFVGEVPMFFLSGWLIGKLGHSNTMTLVLGAFGLRSLLYSFLINPWYSLPIEVMNGVTFGIFYATMTSYANILAPPGYESTMQGVVGAAFEGLGVALGTLAGGAVYKALNGRWLFRIFGLLAVVLCLAHAVLHITLLKRENTEADSEEREDEKAATEVRLVPVGREQAQSSNNSQQSQGLLT